MIAECRLDRLRLEGIVDGRARPVGVDVVDVLRVERRKPLDVGEEPGVAMRIGTVGAFVPGIDETGGGDRFSVVERPVRRQFDGPGLSAVSGRDLVVPTRVGVNRSLETCLGLGVRVVPTRVGVNRRA